MFGWSNPTEAMIIRKRAATATALLILYHGWLAVTSVVLFAALFAIRSLGPGVSVRDSGLASMGRTSCWPTSLFCFCILLDVPVCGLDRAEFVPLNAASSEVSLVRA